MKLPNLKWKTQPKQLLGILPLALVLPAANSWVLLLRKKARVFFLRKFDQAYLILASKLAVCPPKKFFSVM
jgi:hypothetical protein